jgi:hypothetical protein
MPNYILTGFNNRVHRGVLLNYCIVDCYKLNVKTVSKHEFF